MYTSICGQLLSCFTNLLMKDNENQYVFDKKSVHAGNKVKKKEVCCSNIDFI